MNIKKFLKKLHEDERSSADPTRLVAKAARQFRKHVHSAGMESEHLLITPQNAVGVSNECGDYYFHRDLIADMSPDAQVTLLRRIRRSVHNMFMVDQQQHSVDEALDAWAKDHNPDDGPQPLPPYPETDPGHITLTDLENAGISQKILGRGTGYALKHMKELTAALKRAPGFEDMIVIGEDLMAADIMMQLRAQAAVMPSVPTGNDADNLKQLRASAASMPPSVLQLYRDLEIPFIGNVPSNRPGGSSNIGNGSIRFNGEAENDNALFNTRFVAAHELCHALIGHDFINNRYRHTHESSFAIPEAIAEAAHEFKQRMEKVIQNDPEILGQWQQQQGNRPQFFSELQEALSYLQQHHQNDRNKENYEKMKLGWDYELVCNYFALRSASFAREPEAMRFLSPKMSDLCDTLEKSIHLQQETIRDIKRYYDNPERDAMFSVILKERPSLGLPDPTQARQI